MTEPGTLWTGAGQDSLHSSSETSTSTLGLWQLLFFYPAFTKDFSLCFLHIHTPFCSTPGPPKFLLLCTSCSFIPGLSTPRAESKLCRFSLLRCLWVRWTWLFLFVCMFGLVGNFLGGFGFFGGGTCIFFSRFICSFFNVFLIFLQTHRSELQLHSFLFCGRREQNGSSQDAVFPLPPCPWCSLLHGSI